MSAVGSEFPILLNQTNLVGSSKYQWSAPMASGYIARRMRMALTQFIMYNAIPNIASTLNNVSFTYTINNMFNSPSNFNQTCTVNLIPNGTTTGVYVSINDINVILQAVMFANGHYLLDTNNQPFYFLSIASIAYADRFVISSIPIPMYTDLSNVNSPYNGFKVPTTSTAGITAFTSTSMPQTEGNMIQLNITSSQYGLATSLGFPVGSYPTSPTTSPVTGGTQIATLIPSINIPQIADVTSLCLQCNWVVISQFGNVAKQVAQIPINAGYNETITFQPPVPTYVPIMNGHYSSFDITLCKQDGSPLVNNLEAASIVMTFLIKPQSSERAPEPPLLESRMQFTPMVGAGTFKNHDSHASIQQEEKEKDKHMNGFNWGGKPPPKLFTCPAFEVEEDHPPKKHKRWGLY